jgi:hypothetical protein
MVAVRILDGLQGVGRQLTDQNLLLLDENVLEGLWTD